MTLASYLVNFTNFRKKSQPNRPVAPFFPLIRVEQANPKMSLRGVDPDPNRRLFNVTSPPFLSSIEDIEAERMVQNGKHNEFKKSLGNIYVFAGAGWIDSGCYNHRRSRSRL
jgi:hypothetical protein